MMMIVMVMMNIWLFSLPVQLVQSTFFMPPLNTLRVALLNFKGGRAQQRFKRLLVSNMVSQEKLDVLILQETLTDRNNEVDWGLWWTGWYGLSHDTNLSAGVAVLFPPRASSTEIIPGRVLAIRDLQGFSFCLVNVDAPNQGSGRLHLFQNLSSFVEQCGRDEGVVLGEDWKCTTHWTGQHCRMSSATDY